MLVVGGDGTLGSALVMAAQAGGWEVAATTRRGRDRQAEGIEWWPLDLGTLGSNGSNGSYGVEGAVWVPSGFGVVVVCAAVTGLEACRRDPEGTRRVNVEGTLRGVEQARRDGAFVVWLSSNLVFDGESPRVKDGTPVSPVCEYGRQKAVVEEALAGDAGVARVRLTKVIGPGWKLLEDWCRTWEEGGAVRAFEDLWVAPVTLEATVQGLLRIAGERRGGGWQFSGPEDVTYAALARALASKVGVGEDRVESVGRGGVVVEEHAPRHTTLDTRRAEAELGMRFAGVDEVLDVWLAARRIRAMDITQGGVV